MKKKVFSVCMAVIMLFGIFTVSAAAMTKSEFNSKLTNLKKTYYHGYRWTASFDGGWECYGYANMISYNVFGKSAKYWTKSYDLSGVKAGDVIQYGNTSGSGHTIFVTNVSGDTITYTDCNSDFNCTVKWNQTVSKSSKKMWSYSFSYRCVAPDLEEDDPLGKPVDIGTNFYAVLINVPAWKHLHYEENGNVDLRSAQDNTRQIWKFERQSDLSYKIISTYDGKLLDVAGAGQSKGTNVQTFVDHGDAAQQWFFYGSSGHYYIRAKHSKLVLDLDGNNSNEGTNIQMWEYNGSDAQIFQVYHTEMNPPTLSVTAGTSTSNTHLTWTSALGTNVYNVRIKQNDLDNSIWNVTSTTCDVKLPAGTYTAYIDACNYTSVRKSNEVTFTVISNDTEIKTSNNQSEGRCNLTTKITNLTQPAVYIAAMYASDGRLLDIEIEDINTGAENAQASLTRQADAKYIKIFLWDSLNGLKPLTECEKIDL